MELQAEGATKSISKEPEANENATEQGPPRARVNSLFPEQQTTGDGLGEEEVPGSLSASGVGLLELSNVFDTDFLKKIKWSTLGNFVISLYAHKGGGCSHVVNEVKAIAENSGTISSEDQIKEQVTIMAQHIIDGEYLLLACVAGACKNL